MAGTDLITPFLTDEIAKVHAGQGRTPVVVYSESVKGNPYEATCVVRFIAHFPGFLGGEKTFGENELCFGFSKRLADAAGVPDNVLFIPSIDTSVYVLPERPIKRKGSCFYADKYRKVHGGVPYDVTKNSVEIKRGELGEQSQAEIVQLLQTCEFFYTYENTALVIEAMLCGCPAVFIPNPWLTEIISDHELGREGYAWGTDPTQITWATETVGQAARSYHARVERFWSELDLFIEKSAEHADRFASEPPIRASRFVKKLTVSELLLLAIARALPLRIAHEFAKFVSTSGFKRPGSVLWDDWLNRSKRDQDEQAASVQKAS